ncbi:phosphotransferase family protein [Microtetraspora sp. AC03309]|uniref:phosphotransferase family protein n=1 Tax=Microtetraspora sp. AC03309 TaxID=2779376 RepID=UPI001E4B8245|nr:phosphotransferase family protein [Microtetraspora sp. AC03309]MCC5578132.1 phosphotransferase family protein [Microtetraspora sp. AC03309]
MTPNPGTEHESLRAAVETLARTAYGEGRGVTALTRLSGGASRSTWQVDLTGGSPGLILQRQRAGGVPGQIGQHAEAAVLRAAAAAGVPVPRVIAASGDPVSGEAASGEAVSGEAVSPDVAALGEFVLTERVPGESSPAELLRAPGFQRARERFAAEAGTALAALHAIDPGTVPELPARDPLAFYRDVLDDLGEPHPALEIGFAWLEAHRPPPAEPAVVHGDFRLGNLLLDGDRLRAVLDWELAHVGDPAEDLGWLCVRSWRFGGPGRAGGVAAIEDVLAAYHAAGGSRAVTPEAVRWWEVFGNVKWGVICVLQAHAHRSGAERSVELAAIGRRTATVERDLLDLLGVPAPPVPGGMTDGASASCPPHDAPGAAELVSAVREFLLGEVLTAVEGRTAYLTRVAANSLAIAAREITMGADLAAGHRRRLDALGVADDRELARRIRDGSLRGEKVATAVAEAVRDKLLVAAPRRVHGPTT